MSHPNMSYRSKFVAALVGTLLTAFVVSRQLFLFSVSRNASGIAGGRPHFLWAMIAGFMFCVAAALMLRFFIRLEKDKWVNVAITSTGSPPGFLALKPPSSPPSDFIRLARVDPLWLPEGQADDRMPMDGSVPDSGQTAAGQRSFARRTHQSMFKKWSQARSD